MPHLIACTLGDFHILKPLPNVAKVPQAWNDVALTQESFYGGCQVSEWKNGLVMTSPS